MADGTTEGAAHAADVVGACVGANGSAIGMPQLCFDWFPNQIFWLVVTLVVIFLILSRVALPRIGAVLAERSGTITNDIAAAEDLKEKAKAAEGAYDKALADARAEANRIIAETRASIQSDLDVELKRADAEIAARTAESEKSLAAIRDSAVASVTSVAQDTAAALVEALGGKGDSAAVTAAVANRMKG
jgi:F-type H+-transporting ATPase subunit b